MGFARWFLPCVVLCLGLGQAFPRPRAVEDPKKGIPFVAVFIDDATEKALGPFPYDREQYAKAVAALRRAKADAVVLKFFMDQAKSRSGDDRLAAEINAFPVYLQACFDPLEMRPHPLPTRFDRTDQYIKGKERLLSGRGGWIPLEKFSGYCAGIGFVDLASEEDVFHVPMLLRYKDRVVPSLQLLVLERVLGKRACFDPGRKMQLGATSLPIDKACQVQVPLPKEDKVDYIPFVDLLEGRFDPERVRGKVVIVGYDSEKTPTLPTPLGRVRMHRVFYYHLVGLYEGLMSP